VSLLQYIDFRALGDERGHLISLESGRNIPFEIKRVYYIYGTLQGVARGFHAHKKLQQVAVCLRGSCRFVMNDGREIQDTVLDTPERGLLIEPMIWHEMYDFSDDCVVMVIASDFYDEQDYIRDIQEFHNHVQ